MPGAWWEQAQRCLGQRQGVHRASIARTLETNLLGQAQSWQAVMVLAGVTGPREPWLANLVVVTMWQEGKVLWLALDIC